MFGKRVSLRILGVDPGLSAMGWGLIEKAAGGLAWIAGETIKTSPRLAFQERLRRLHDEISRVIETQHPDILAMEKPIYCQNIKTALTLGQAGGMAILAAAEAGVEVVEFTPLEVKKATTGKGKATKEQVQKMVRVLLELKALPSDEHVSDALACAVCYAHSEKQLRWRKMT